MNDEEAKVIFCSRGGYGAVHLIGKLDFTKFRQHPKWLIGFSDITALHNLFQQNGFASLHAPMARHLTVEPEDDFCTQALKDVLFGQALGGTEAFSYVCPGHKLNHKGKGKGVLRGGNLSVFYGLRGTPYDIPAEGTILFIEDVGKSPIITIKKFSDSHQRVFDMHRLLLLYQVIFHNLLYRKLIQPQKCRIISSIHSLPDN